MTSDYPATYPVVLPGCDIQSAQFHGLMLIVEADTFADQSHCPTCGHVSHHIHSYRVRTLSDLPVSGYAVCIKLRMKRFRCRQRVCARQTWTETVPTLAERYTRRTQRLTNALWHIAHALGGKPGSLLAYRLQMPVSRDTLLRTLRSKTTLTKNTSDLDEPRIIGIDDWAKRKGQTYGTIIVDLERHQVIDLLPDREPQTVATWLSRHPNIEIVARDRSAQYALGIHQGAPQATQVTDRWHLLKNLWDVIERCLISAKRDKNKLKNTQNKPKDYPREPLPRSAPEEAYRQVRREQRVQQYHQVHYLREQGLSTRRIAQLMSISRGTVLRYLAAETFPASKPRYIPSKLDSFLPYLKERVAHGCTHTRQLWHEIQQQGYDGSAQQLDKWLRLQRRKASQNYTISRPSDEPQTS